VILGYQKNCCDCPPGTALPNDVEVTFSNLPSQIAGPDLCTVELSSCYGEGAKVRITGPAGTAGPISAVAVVDGGSGYAKRGRQEPDLLITGGGSGMVATPTLAMETDECGLPYWVIDSVSVSGGTRYAAGQTLNVATQSGSYADEKATLSLRTTLPTVTASVFGGSGAALSVTLATPAGKAAGEVPYYVESVTVNNGGSGYTNGTRVYFSSPGSRLDSPAAATASTKVQRSAPDLTPYVWGDDGTTAGSGAVLTATTSATIDEEGKPAWEVSAISIANGGSGYEVGEYLWYEELDPAIGSSPPYYVLQIHGWWITSVDGSGAITGLGVNPDFPFPNGLFYYGTDTGIIESVSVTDGGQYDSGVPGTVAVIEGGKYYGESDDLPAHVADVTISISQAVPSNGTGAKLTAVVGDDPLDVATFGTITGVTIEDGGTGYLAFSWIEFANDLYEGLTFRVPRTACACCRYDGCDSHGHKTGLLTWPSEQYQSGTVGVSWGGQSGPHRVSLAADYRVLVPGLSGVNSYSDSTLAIEFSSGTGGAPYACEPLSFTASGLTVGAESAVATVEAASSPLPCAEIFGATTIKATIESSDYFRQVKRQFQTSGGTKYYRYDTHYFRGSELAGEFELTPRGKINLADSVGGALRWYYLWSYQYAAGSCIKTARTGLSAGHDEVYCLMRDDYGAMRGGAFVGLLGFNSASIAPGPDDSLLKAEGWFECLEYELPQPPQSLTPVLSARVAGCGCRLENLTVDGTVQDHVPALVIPSDAAGDHTLLSSTTVTETGSLADEVTITFSLP